MKLVRSICAISVVTASVILSGCGGGAPTLSDVQKALAKQPGAEMIKLTVNSVDNCEEVRSDVYSCDVEASTEIMEMVSTNVAQLKFKKSKDGQWNGIN